MANADPLAQLRDIHIPTSIDWGWYGFIALIIVSVLLIISWLIIYYRRKTLFRREALQELAAIEHFQQQTNTQQLLSSCNQLLRRVCLTLYPTEQVASLTGQAWLEFLDQHSKKKQKNFSQGVGKILADGLYQEHIAAFDDQALIKQIRLWIQEK